MEEFQKYDKADTIFALMDCFAQRRENGIRTKLIKAFNWWLKVDDEKLELICDIIETLHNSNWITDDIEDTSDGRKGKPAPATINAANYAIFIALQKVLQLNHPNAYNVFIEQIIDSCRGRGIDIYRRCSFKCPTEEEYKDMVIRKTGDQFVMAVRLMQLLSTKAGDYNPLLNVLSVWFQIRDDYANLVDTHHETNDFAEDLTKSKFSFPVMHAINNFPHDHQIMAILQQHTKDRAVKEQAIHHLSELGSLEYTARTLIELEKDCRKIVTDLGGNPDLLQFLDEHCSIYREFDSWDPRIYPQTQPHNKLSTQLNMEFERLAVSPTSSD
ncbi:hypothetical protein Aperf_G00000084051 [Anoplocephala perfoliata]